jgi:photosystem II stability/assembly factor-like uncharacterized protein
MKKTLLQVLLIACLCHPLLAQIWDPHNAGYSLNVNIWDVEAVDENVIWTGSLKGTFSGNAWNVSPSNLISKSTDGGLTWTELTVPVPLANWGVSHIHAFDADTAWLAMYSFASPGDVYKTTDGGITWQDLPATTQFTNFIYFWDASKGIAIADPKDGYFEIMTTEDGGATWTRVPQTNIPDPVVPSESGSFGVGWVIDNHVWWGSSHGRIFHSRDYGQTWAVTETDIAATGYTWIEGITFQDSLHGFAHSAVYNSAPFQATLVFTEDGGDTWQTHLPGNYDYSIFEAKYLPDSPYLMKTSRASNGAGPYLTSLSSDHGKTWMDIDEGTPISRFDFVSNKTGFAGKFKNTDEPAQVYRYTGDPISGIFSQQPLEAEVLLYPNPASQAIFLKVNAPQTSDFTVLLNDPQGRLLRKMNFQDLATLTVSIPIADFVPGNYWLTVSNPEGSVTKQFIKR